jgi:hypothetical protein
MKLSLVGVGRCFAPIHLHQARGSRGRCPHHSLWVTPWELYPYVCQYIILPYGSDRRVVPDMALSYLVQPGGFLSGMLSQSPANSARVTCCTTTNTPRRRGTRRLRPLTSLLRGVPLSMGGRVLGAACTRQKTYAAMCHSFAVGV